MTFTSLALHRTDPEMSPDSTDATSSIQEWLTTLGLGAIALALLAAAAQYLLDNRTQHRLRVQQQMSLASALQGELAAIIRLGPERYLPAIANAKRRLRARREHSFGPASTQIELLEVYAANVEQIGILPQPLPGLIASEYLDLRLAQSDLKTIFLPGWNELPAVQRLFFLEEAEGRLLRAIEQAGVVQAALEELLTSTRAARRISADATT